MHKVLRWIGLCLSVVAALIEAYKIGNKDGYDEGYEDGWSDSAVEEN